MGDQATETTADAGMDTFANPATQDYEETIADDIDSFDNGSYVDFDDLGGDDDVQDSKQESDSEDGEEGGEKKEISEDSQVNQLEEKEKTETVEKKADDKGDEDPDESDKELEDTKSDEVDAESKVDVPAGKVVKAFHGGKKFDIPEEATVKVKIAGKGEIVAIKDLKENYSGKVQYDKKFNELGDKEKEYTAKNETFVKERDFISNKILGARELIDSAMKKGTDPLEGINFMLDLMNYDTYDFNERLEDHMATKLESYMQMDEVERENFKLNQRNTFLQKRQESKGQDFEKEQAARELRTRVDGLRVAQGISEEQYVEAHNVLTDVYEGQKFTPEQVINYAAMAPHVDVAAELMTPYEDQMNDDDLNELISDIAQNLRLGKSTKESVTQMLAEEFTVDDYIAEINDKASRTGEARTAKHVTTEPETNHLESFDDYEDEEYGYN